MRGSVHGVLARCKQARWDASTRAPIAVRGLNAPNQPLLGPPPTLFSGSWNEQADGWDFQRGTGLAELRLHNWWLTCHTLKWGINMLVGSSNSPDTSVGRGGLCFLFFQSLARCHPRIQPFQTFLRSTPWAGSPLTYAVFTFLINACNLMINAIFFHFAMSDTNTVEYVA